MQEGEIAVADRPLGAPGAPLGFILSAAAGWPGI